MQEAQRDTISAFEEYMDMCMLSDWAAEKKVLFDSAMPDTALPGPAGQLAAASITAPYSPSQFRSSLPAGMQARRPLSLCWKGNFLCMSRPPFWCCHKRVLMPGVAKDCCILPAEVAGQYHTRHLHGNLCLASEQFRVSMPGCYSGASSQAQYGPSHAQGLHGRVKSYAEALQKLNEADRSKEKMSAVVTFGSAAASDPDGASHLLPHLPCTWMLRRQLAAMTSGCMMDLPGLALLQQKQIPAFCRLLPRGGLNLLVGFLAMQPTEACVAIVTTQGGTSLEAAPNADGERRQTMGKLWGLLRSMVSRMPGPSASSAARTQALVQGARAYLAQGHSDYLTSIVKGNRAQACLPLLLLPCHVPLQISSA